MKYYHMDGNQIQPQRIFCVARNYAEHARELKNEVPDQPIMFMKPATALVFPNEPVPFPRHGHELHHEVEVVVLIGKQGRPSDENDARDFIQGLTIGLDLTLRDVQNELKKKGWPWEASKSFDASALVGPFIPYGATIDLANIAFSCEVNDAVRQNGNTSQMLFPIPSLIQRLSLVWELLPGDIVFTGTPAGVGSLRPGDSVTVAGPLFGRFGWKIG